MSIKVTWTPLGSTPDTLTLYWSDTKFTPVTLPGNSVNIPANSSEYTDTSVPANTFRYYMVKATKAGLEDMYSQCLLLANIANTGPGNNAPIRGDWENGFMDILTPAQFFTTDALKVACGLPANWGGTPEFGLNNWFKFVYKKRILFIPSGPLSAPGTLGWSDIYNKGLMYGTDDTGLAPMSLTALGANPAITVPVNQRKIVYHGDATFKVRSPKLSDRPTDQVIDTTHDSYVDGEWWNTICRFTMDSRIEVADRPRIPPFRWGDYIGAGAANYQCAATPHFFTTAGSVVAVSNANFSGHIARNIKLGPASSAVHWVPVLELVL